MRTFSQILFSLLFICLMSACGMRKGNLRSDEADIVILYTTDIHGQLLNHDFITQKDDSCSLSNMSTLVKRERKANPDGVVLIDGGDLIEGSPSMYYYNYVAIRDPHLAIRVMNYLDYDAVVMGNHDFEPGEAIYRDHLLRDLEMPLLCANAIDTRSDRPMFKPYTIVERNGFRIAILGLTTAESHKLLSATAVPHLRFEYMLETARYWLDVIENKERPDMTILVAHSGSEKVARQSENGQTFYDGAFDVARSLPNIDLMLIGHDHQVRQDTIIGSSGNIIPVLQPASHSEEFGKVSLHLKSRENGHAEIARCDMERIPSINIPQDEEFNAYFQKDIEVVTYYLDKPLGMLNINAKGGESLIGPSELQSFIHGVQLSLSGADLSMASALSTFSEIMQGEVSMRTLFSLYRYENQLTKVWMKGSEIKQFLEYGYGRQFAQMTSFNDHLLAFRYDADGNIIMGRWGPELVMPQYYYTSCGGLNYDVDVSRPAGNKVIIHDLADGRPFDLNAQYVVCMSSFQAQGGGGYITNGLGWDDDERKYRTITSTNKDIRYFIAQFLLNSTDKTKAMYPVGSWKVIPNSWWAHAKDRDVEMLLPYIRK